MRPVHLDSSGSLSSAQIARAVTAAVEAAQAAGDPEVEIEAEPATPEVAAAAAAAGFVPVRTTLQLRRPLPLEAQVRGRGPGIATRAFRVGADDDAWLEVNNRAFAWHPDQSDRTRADLTALQAEAWFRPDGFLVHEGRRRHPRRLLLDQDPCRPRATAGRDLRHRRRPRPPWPGLGRALVVAGLDWLADQGLGLAMLYVEADNEPARHLYRSSGLHRAPRPPVVAAGPARC